MVSTIKFFGKEELEVNSTLLFDPQEPAYYITRSLFQDNKDVQDILKGDKTISAIRKKFPDHEFLPPNDEPSFS